MQLTQHWTGHDGTALTLRPVRADDASRLDVLIRSLAPRDRRWRFHGAVNALTPERLRVMTTSAPAQQLALVVVAHAPGRETLIADARCAVDATGEAAEFGVMVAPAWRRLGLGARATLALRDAAAEAGLRWLHGAVLADNAPMLALVQRCGFLCTPNRRDAGLVGIELQLDREPALLRTPPAAPSRWRWSLPRHAASHCF
jgi:RimJ/RimL family protein N-acetyltransferase